MLENKVCNFLVIVYVGLNFLIGYSLRIKVFTKMSVIPKSPLIYCIKCLWVPLTLFAAVSLLDGMLRLSVEPADDMEGRNSSGNM